MAGRSLIKYYWILQNARVTALSFLGYKRKTNRGITLSPTLSIQIRVKIASSILRSLILIKSFDLLPSLSLNLHAATVLQSIFIFNAKSLCKKKFVWLLFRFIYSNLCFLYFGSYLPVTTGKLICPHSFFICFSFNYNVELVSAITSSPYFSYVCLAKKFIFIWVENFCFLNLCVFIILPHDSIDPDSFYLYHSICLSYITSLTFHHSNIFFHSSAFLFFINYCRVFFVTDVRIYYRLRHQRFDTVEIAPT